MLAVAAVIVVGIALAIVVAGATSSPDDPRTVSIPLADVEEGVTPMLLGDDSVFMVREGRSVWTLSSDAQHMQGERVAWCPPSETFVEEAHGSLFDIDGVKLGGPARSGLDRFRTEVADGTVFVHRDDRQAGPPLTARSERPEPDVTVHCPDLVPAAVPAAS